ncbi:MAG: hypothetical protein A3G18_01210 [Rhodospirillales bacterium RIFCSPLOWO2_12_FULL_58_28]|nr:MAG: hypothetical protein A3H92_04410 [Rhodospirillales bacterium RIFCSPLOWO2_02_FULL_58_16]OHC78022.1 MAG: hypothetical protein A3G18_01210 [Rhodospirillales bacterium RIFCSPLOWO2_12_FULL_58_28]
MTQFITVFTMVFLAELGDKTQLATMLFAADRSHGPLMVFIAAAVALCLSTAIAVFVGSAAGHYLERVPVKLFAGVGFIIIGAWTVFDHFRNMT